MTRYRELAQKEKEEKDDLSEQLKRQGEALNKTVEQFNEEISRLWETVETAINKYNVVLEKSKLFVDEIICKKDEVREKFSEEWKESPEADTFAAWLREWQSYIDDNQDVSIDFSEDCSEIDTPNTASINKAFDELPLEIEDPNPKEKVSKFKRRRVQQKNYPN